MFALPKFLPKLSHSTHVKAASKHLSPFCTIKSPLLTRDFIRDRLYNPKGGYFCQDNSYIGELVEPLELADLFGHEAFTRILVEKYPKNAWLSPTELFKPWYGMTVGNYIHKVVQELAKDAANKEKSPKIKILEVGAGNGSAAAGILSFFKNYEPKLYNELQYKIVEISPQMCQKAKANLEKGNKELFDKGHITIINEDFLNYKEKDNDLTFVLLFEVLDDMPHDRVYYSEDKQQWYYETWVEFDDQSGSTNLRETRKPISDSLIREAVDLLNTLPAQDTTKTHTHKHKLFQKAVKMIYNRTNDHNIFLPTTTIKMLKNIKEVLPSHHLVIADFDMLKSSNRQGANSPIVSKKLEKYFDIQEFESYLVKRGEADIFFPTDFHYLRHAYKNICGKDADVYKTYEFMDQYSKSKWAELNDGYNPLREDFLNTSVLTTSSSNKCENGKFV